LNESFYEVFKRLLLKLFPHSIRFRRFYLLTAFSRLCRIVSYRIIHIVAYCAKSTTK